MPDGYLGLFIPNDDFEKRFAFVQTKLSGIASKAIKCQWIKLMKYLRS